MRKLICWLAGHKWLKPYHKTDYPEFICQRCGAYGSSSLPPPKEWPRMPETKAPRQYIVGRAPERPDRAPVAEWLDPLISPPPRGMKIQLLTDWEIAVYGHWSDTGYVAWAPLMQKPAWLVQRLRDKALARRGKVDVIELRWAQGSQGYAHSIGEEKMKLMEMDAAFATQAMLSGKATVEEVAFLNEMVFAYAADVAVSNSDYHRLQRLTGGELSTETPICNR